MTILNHTLGFPRVGLRRELKKAQESYWAGNSTREELLAVGRELRARHWDQQKQAGIDLLPVGDFAWYDHVLTTSLLLGNVPPRHQNKDGSVDIDTLFRIGRGRAPTGEPAAAAEMTKWFNTNYHYMVPEFVKGQQFKLTWTQLLEEVDEALALGHKVKPVLLGPVTYLWLGKVKGEQFDRLSLLNDILPVYQQVLAELAKRGIEWVQIDEPALVLELPQAWLDAYKPAYDALQGQVKLLLTTYFEGVTPNLDTVCMSISYMVKMTLLNCTSVCLLTGCCLRVLSMVVTSGAPILPRNMRKLRTLSANVICGWHLPAHCCTALST